MFRCNKCGKLYKVKPKKCPMCKNTDFSDGWFKRPKK